MSTFKKPILDLVIEIFNLRQRQMPKTYDKIKVELVIVEQTLAFNSSTNLLEKLRCISKFQTNCMAVLYVIDNSHSDR